VYRVEAGGEAFVLKVAEEREDEADWRGGARIQRLAAEAGLAPRVVHVDQERRAVVTVFVADRSFPALYRHPQTHGAALNLLGQTVRRLHGLAIPPDARARDPREFLAQMWQGVRAGLVVPGFAQEAIERGLAEEAPASERAVVLSHNDLNPSNLVYDGEKILIFDWATAGPMDAHYDLATLAVFFRMDGDTCRRLFSAYDGAPVVALSERFLYTRRLVAVLAGTAALYVARQLKHPGATGGETLASTLPLGEFYQRMLAGALKLGTPEGQWAFGLALLKESITA
jgi:aminoglycoside phosphotransferase (APT) family kinase protein